MSASTYDELMQRASAELTQDEMRRLAQFLDRRAEEEAGSNHQMPAAQTLYDALMQRGIIGSITDSPGDLSTNPKYMEGFGEHGG